MEYHLVNPSEYMCFGQRRYDSKKKKVKNATISPCDILDGWYDLIVYFADGSRYYDSSPSLRGAKQIFGIRAKPKAKWEYK